MTKKKKVIQFPAKENRPKHIYETRACAGCQKDIAEDEIYTEIVMTSENGKEKKHIALCDSCADVAKYHGALD